jgi:hypothetical protein
LWTAGFLLVLALVPIALFSDTWGRYLDDGVLAITANSARNDNAAILHLAGSVGIPAWLAVMLLMAVAAVIVLIIRDTFWPIVWLMIALLPVAWMYSLLTLIPLFCAVVRRPTPWGVGPVVLAAALAASSPPFGMWPTAVWPVVLLLGAVALLQIDEIEFWPDHRVLGRMLRRLGGPGTAESARDVRIQPRTSGSADGPP